MATGKYAGKRTTEVRFAIGMCIADQEDGRELLLNDWGRAGVMG